MYMYGVYDLLHNLSIADQWFLPHQKCAHLAYDLRDACTGNSLCSVARN